MTSALMIPITSIIILNIFMFSLHIPKSTAGADYTAYVTNAITGIVNIHFGYRITRANHIKEMLRMVKRFSNDTGDGHRVVRDQLALLSKIGWACFLVSLVTPVLNTPLTVQR